MKRKFLAKAITLGLMLAVPFGVDAAETLVADKTVDGEKKIYSEAASIIGDKYQYNYTINGRLAMSGASYIKEVNQLTFGTDGKESSFAGGSIEAKNITVKGRLWTAKGTSIDTSGELLFVNNPQIDSPEDTNNKVLNCGSINAKAIKSPIYFRNQGTIEVQKAIEAEAGFNNEKTTASIKAAELIVEKNFNNKGNISVNSITANLDISKNLVNDGDAAIIQTNKITVTSGGITNKGTITSKDENSKLEISSAGNVNNMGSLLNIGSLTSNNGVTNATGAIIQTDKINNTRGDIINNGSLKSTTEINSVGTIDNYGVLKTKNLISNTRLYNRQGATLETESIDGATGTISNYGTLTNQNKIESYGAIYNRGQLKSNILVSKSTVTNGGFNNDKDSADPNSKMEVGSLKAEAIINNGQLIADSVETQKNIANGNSAALNINNTLKIEGILKNAGSLETKDLIISQASDNANRDSYSTGSLKVNGKLTLNENAGFSFEDKREGGDISIGTLETKGNNVISVKNGVTDINVGTLDGNNTIINVESDAADQIKIDQNNDEGLTVKGTGEMTDYYGDDIAGGLNKLKDTVGIKDGNKKTTLKLSAGSVTGDVTGYTNENGDMVGYNEDINKDNAGISEMASIALMAWRAENNDMNKRLGELRNSKGEHGVWTRMVRGQSKYGAQNVKNQYSTYQLGYDEKLSVDKNWTVGAAVSYTDASSSFSTGHGENKSTGFAVYGSYLSDNGSFIDLIAKAARLKNEFDVLGGAGKGDYETNGYSLSAEYGKRFTKDNGFWIEPQVELTYGYVGAVDYLTNNDVKVRQNGMDSLVGRIGFAMGRNIKAGNVYARASYLYDFDGETDVTFSKNSVTRGFKQDLGGGWWEVGVGTNLNLSEATHLYFDVEKTYGGNVATPWQWNAGVRWSF
ncbi:autotransporter outer membrane beta-barrel domain-containing protein [Phascolarctobacterium succinatutens]|uniref:autotransporter outer membrane beta-barrel domain-containing protein n=1 Tax=Phascolarctobacterium succinatutens TaxID=626940 RepID=UPI003AB386ED